MYLPVNELATGTDLDVPVEIDPRHARNPSAAVAATVWKHTKHELRQISTLSTEHACKHNLSEFARAGLS
jgi:hypothetical protein